MAVPVAVIVVGIIVLLLLVKALHLASRSCAPFLQYTSSSFNNLVLSRCPLLTEPYIPPLLWGKSGHIQTVVYGKKGRFRIRVPVGSRHSVVLDDGATLTYDMFEPKAEHESHRDLTMVVCPGINNSSESDYVRTFVNYCQKRGYRVAVLNHLGAIRHIPLTSPRMFTYGGTAEYAKLVELLMHAYPDTKLVAVGFSMGGNVVCKYLGEDERNQQHFICAISCCQGYDAYECLKGTMRWEHMRRGYNWAMTQNMKKILRCHSDMLFGAEAVKRYGSFDTERLFRSTCLQETDELYSRRRAGYRSLDEYYKTESCANYLHNITLPMFILNAIDDPLVPEIMHDIPKQFASDRDNVLFAATRHGGHLGYFEGGMLMARSLTWLDKVVVQYSDAVVQVTHDMQRDGTPTTPTDPQQDVTTQPQSMLMTTAVM